MVYRVRKATESSFRPTPAKAGGEPESRNLRTLDSRFSLRLIRPFGGFADGDTLDDPALLQAQETFAKHINLTLTPSFRESVTPRLLSQNALADSQRRDRGPRLGSSGLSQLDSVRQRFLVGVIAF